MDKGQTIRFSKQELKLIKSTFADNEELITALYKHMLQIPLETTEKQALKALKKPDVMTILRKEFVPSLKDDVPVEQRIDLFMTVYTEQVDTDDLHIAINARRKVVDYLEQQLNKLENDEESSDDIELDSLVTPGKSSMEAERVHADLRARNTIVNHVVQRIVELKGLAGKAEETPEEQEKRLQQDSNK